MLAKWIHQATFSKRNIYTGRSEVLSKEILEFLESSVVPIFLKNVMLSEPLLRGHLLRELKNLFHFTKKKWTVALLKIQLTLGNWIRINISSPNLCSKNQNEVGNQIGNPLFEQHFHCCVAGWRHLSSSPSNVSCQVSRLQYRQNYKVRCFSRVFQ